MIQTFIVVFNLKTPVRVATLRFAVFNSVLIDYLMISLRTLGHYPTNPKGPLETLSFLLACFTLTCFTIELVYMYRLVNENNFINNKNLTPVQKNLREVYYEGIKEETIRTSWFARNYNFLYLIRFSVFTVVLINLQYLQILQVLLNLILIVSFSAATVYYHSQIGVFDDKCNAIIKIAEEFSLSALIIMTNVFCFDSFASFLTLNYKHFMVVSFTLILVLNVALEITSVLVSILGYISERRKQSKKINPKGALDLESAKASFKINREKSTEKDGDEEEKKVEAADVGEWDFGDLEAFGSTKKNKIGFGAGGNTNGPIDIRMKKSKPLRFRGIGMQQAKWKINGNTKFKDKTKLLK